MTETVLELFLDLAKHFNSAPAGTQLLRHLVDHILFNPALWIHTPVKVSWIQLARLVVGIIMIHHLLGHTVYNLNGKQYTRLVFVR